MHLYAAIAVLVVASAIRAAAGDTEVLSPRGTFSILQSFDGIWTSKLRFTSGNRADVILTSEFLWPASYYISENDEWILRIQKSGSGENISFLYRINPTGRLWRMEQRLDEIAIQYLEDGLGVATSELYHVGIRFIGWNIKARVLRFTVYGSSTEKSGEGVERELVYDLEKHSVRTP
jgi:hypothetical protein